VKLPQFKKLFLLLLHFLREYSRWWSLCEYLGSISPTFYAQLLRAQITKAWKIQSSCQSFWRFWEKRLVVERWWNRSQLDLIIRGLLSANSLICKCQICLKCQISSQNVSFICEFSIGGPKYWDLSTANKEAYPYNNTAWCWYSGTPSENPVKIWSDQKYVLKLLF